MHPGEISKLLKALRGWPLFRCLTSDRRVSLVGGRGEASGRDPRHGSLRAGSAIGGSGTRGQAPRRLVFVASCNFVRRVGGVAVPQLFSSPPPVW